MIKRIEEFHYKNFGERWHVVTWWLFWCIPVFQSKRRIE